MVLCKSSSRNRVEAAQGRGGVWIARGKTAARKEVEVEEEVKKSEQWNCVVTGDATLKARI
jgi:hypothetical protein